MDRTEGLVRSEFLNLQFRERTGDPPPPPYREVVTFLLGSNTTQKEILLVISRRDTFRGLSQSPHWPGADARYPVILILLHVHF